MQWREIITGLGAGTAAGPTYFSIFKRGMKGFYQHCG
jgi:hypothetical protein